MNFDPGLPLIVQNASSNYFRFSNRMYIRFVQNLALPKYVFLSGQRLILLIANSDLARPESTASCSHRATSNILRINEGSEHIVALDCQD